jgi:hypothetical protein
MQHAGTARITFSPHFLFGPSLFSPGLAHIKAPNGHVDINPWRPP